MLRGPVLKGRLTCAACLAALAVLAGCGGASSTIPTAVEDSHSAMATAQLAVRLDSAGKLTKAATATALDDALKELQTSRNSVLGLAPASAEERESVQEALSVLEGCTTSLTTARDAVASDDSDPSLTDGDRALAAAVDRLSALMAKDGGK